MQCSLAKIIIPTKRTAVLIHIGVVIGRASHWIKYLRQGLCKRHRWMFGLSCLCGWGGWGQVYPGKWLAELEWRDFRWLRPESFPSRLVVWWIRAGRSKRWPSSTSTYLYAFSNHSHNFLNILLKNVFLHNEFCVVNRKVWKKTPNIWNPF